MGISVDSPEDSRSFAGGYGIEFPLLSDESGDVSRAYVGVDGADVSVPGIVVIRRDGRIVFRQIATGRDDRLTAAQLVATLDRTLGTGANAPRAARGYAVLERLQVAADLSAGAARDGGDWDATVVGSASVLLPLGRYFAVGPWGRVTSDSLDVNAMLALRAPILAETGAFELGVGGGYTVMGATGPNLATRAGVWVALTPRWALHVNATAGVHDDGRLDLVGGVGFSRLVRFRR